MITLNITCKAVATVASLKSIRSNPKLVARELNGIYLNGDIVKTTTNKDRMGMRDTICDPAHLPFQLGCQAVRAPRTSLPYPTLLAHGIPSANNICFSGTLQIFIGCVFGIGTVADAERTLRVDALRINQDDAKEKWSESWKSIA